MDRSEKMQAIITIIKDISVVPETPMTENTEIFYDLHISGDDLDDLFIRMSGIFNLDTEHMISGTYGPAEGAEIIRPLKHALGGRPYKSLTIKDLINICA